MEQRNQPGDTSGWGVGRALYPPWCLPNTLLLCRARAIKYRQENQEAVGGFFSQIGELYVVHHLWGRLGPPMGSVGEPVLCAPGMRQCLSHSLQRPAVSGGD